MAAEGGRERRFESVVAENRRRITAIARSFAHGDEYQDLCQEVLLRLREGLDGFEGRSARSTWVYRVALNTAITFRRRNGRRAEAAGPPAPEGSMERVAAPERGNELLILHEFLRWTCFRVERYTRWLLAALFAISLVLFIFGRGQAGVVEGAYESLGTMACLTAFLAFAWWRTRSRSREFSRELDGYLRDLAG